MDRERLDHIQQELGRVQGHRPIDFALLVEAAIQSGPLGWRDAAELALAFPRLAGEVVRPMHLLEFVAELAKLLNPTSVIDPWAVAPTILAAAHEASGSTRSCGLVWSENLWEAAQRIASLDWRRGDPISRLRELSHERFDLVLAAPPIGMQQPVNPEPDDPPWRTEVGDLILWRAAQLVAERGYVLFHTSDSFFFSNKRRRLWTELAERGIHLRGAISVDRAVPFSASLSTSLVLFGREPTDQLFVGRLEQSSVIRVLVRNLIGQCAADDPHQGALVTANVFRGWRPFILEHELAQVFGSYQMRRLADIGQVRMVQLKPSVAYDPPENCVFVPTLGFGNVSTLPPDLEGKSGYKVLEIELDPTVARAEYVAGLLSSPAGKQLRESVSSGLTVPHLSLRSAETIRLPVPAIAVQAEAVRTDAHLLSMQSAVARLRTELWRHPENAPRMLSQLELAAKADPVQRWLETLPYPLASVLQRYSVLRDPKERLILLLQLFEATAQFACAVLMSILRGDPELFSSSRPGIEGAAGPQRDLFNRADFGLWINLGNTLAKAIRRFREQPDQRLRLEDAAGPTVELMTQLAEKQIWQVLDQARLIRNAHAHGGVLAPGQVEGWLGTLEAMLSKVEQALGSGFDDIDLARVDQGRFVAPGLHVYPRAQRLRGPSDVFQEFELQTRVPLESGHLVFVGRDNPISSVLILVPLVRLGAPPPSSRNACYFFSSRLEDGKFAYVSYHFEDQPKIEVEDTELQKLAHAIAAAPSSMSDSGQ